MSRQRGHPLSPPAIAHDPVARTVPTPAGVSWQMIATGAGLCLLLIVALSLAALALRPRNPVVTVVSSCLASSETETVTVAAPPVVDLEIVRGSAKPAPPLSADAGDANAPAVKLAEENDDFIFAALKAPPQEAKPVPVVAAAEPAPAALPAVLAAQPEAGTCGTSVAFVPSPKLAAQRAAEEDKLVFILHVSGNFEDPGFT